MNYDKPELLEKLAAEYVLGTMNVRVRRRFARHLASSFAAQRAVANWDTRFEPLHRTMSPVTPPGRVWQAVARRTRPTAPARTWVDRIAALGALSMKPALSLCLGMVIALGVVRQAPQVIGLETGSETLAPSYVGLLTDAAGEPALAASSLRRGSILSVKILKPISIPSGHVAQLWALPKDAAPVAIGVVPASGKGEIHLNASAETVFAKVGRLGVSIETSTSAARPSADFILTGHCVKIW